MKDAPAKAVNIASAKSIGNARTLDFISDLIQCDILLVTNECHRVLQIEVGLAVVAEAAAGDINSTWRETVVSSHPRTKWRKVRTTVDARHNWALADLRLREVREEDVQVGGHVGLRGILNYTTRWCYSQSMEKCNLIRCILTDADGVLLRHEWDIDEVIEGAQAIGRDLLVALVELFQDVL